MLTIVETHLFKRLWPLYWSEEERRKFAAFLKASPTSGQVVPKSGGVRKVRWRRTGTGKSGGVRVIYFIHNAAGELVLLTMYAKARVTNISAAELKELRCEYESKTPPKR
ncbi:type II toxin-antitoxin system RelE/ParE family toxin [Oxalobacteraceae bacterium]|nr:type II toxin-antitoxin system RelE/ParE family toxin [Oxalobacteraceae bacterium]